MYCESTIAITSCDITVSRCFVVCPDITVEPVVAAPRSSTAVRRIFHLSPSWASPFVLSYAVHWHWGVTQSCLSTSLTGRANIPSPPRRRAVSNWSLAGSPCHRRPSGLSASCLSSLSLSHPIIRIIYFVYCCLYDSPL